MGTIVGAGITAGFGGWLGGRQSRRNQERQHRFDTEKALSAQGRERAREAIAALRYLERHCRTVVAWSGVPEGELTGEREQYDRLGEAIEYLNDDSVRQQIELVHDVIADTFVVTRFGEHEIDDSEDHLIWRACREGREILGRYLRGEPTLEHSEFIQTLQYAHDVAHADLERQHDEWEQSKRTDKDTDGG